MTGRCPRSHLPAAGARTHESNGDKPLVRSEPEPAAGAARLPSVMARPRRSAPGWVHVTRVLLARSQASPVRCERARRLIRQRRDRPRAPPVIYDHSGLITVTQRHARPQHARHRSDLHAIQAGIDELLGEIERLRRALAALTTRESEAERSGRGALRRSAAGATPAKSPRGAAHRAPRTRKGSAPPRPAAATTASPALPGPARARTAPGATKAAILAALGDGSAMTASEIAAGTGLGRATVSTTLSRLAASGEIAKAARGYQLKT